MARREEQSCGFAIGTYSEDIIEANAKESYGPEYAHPATHAGSESYEMQKAGLVDAKGQITKKGWEVLNEDVGQLERNSLRWLQKTFEGARDEGHGGYNGDELLGTVWFDLDNPHQVETLDIGIDERIDMSDSSYGDLANVVWKGVSRFGESVLGGAIHFFDISDDMKEEISDRAFEIQKKRRARR